MFFDKKVGAYSSNLEYYITKVKSGSLAYIPYIFNVFYENSNKHKILAANFLSEILKTLSLNDIYIIDKEMRKIKYIQPINTDINKLITNKMSDNQKRTVFIFATFNPSGYIREKAVLNLSGYKNTLPFILLRCNDWVYEIRKSAINLLTQSLKYATDDEIINSLSIIEKLRKSKRCDFNSIYSCINERLDNELVYKALKNNNIITRRFCISLFNNLKILNPEILANHIKHENEPLLRKMAFQILVDTNLDVLGLSKAFVKDKCSQNRFLALQYVYNNYCEQSFEIAFNMLLDKNSNIRSLARDIVLKHNPNFDFYKYYLDKIDFNTAISIYGLGEVGCDHNYIKPFLLSDNISVIRASMVTLMNLSPNTYISQITEMLASEYTGIVKTATMLLKKYRNYDFERVLQILNQSQYENTKIKCASLLFLSGKWNSLIYTLTLIGSQYTDLEKLCQAQIHHWICSYNSSYALLSEKNKQLITELIDKKKNFLTSENIKLLIFLSR